MANQRLRVEVCSIADLPPLKKFIEVEVWSWSLVYVRKKNLFKNNKAI